MPLLTAANAFKLGEDTSVLLGSVICSISDPYVIMN